MSEQIHDFNPGTAANGLFWTVPISRDSVTVNPDTGAATLSVTDLEIPDYFTVPNALIGGGPDPVPATVSFDVEWSGALDQMSIANEEVDFTGDFIINNATLSWTAENENGFRYTAEPFSEGFAEVGEMCNGQFFG